MVQFKVGDKVQVPIISKDAFLTGVVTQTEYKDRNSWVAVRIQDDRSVVTYRFTPECLTLIPEPLKAGDWVTLKSSMPSSAGKVLMIIPLTELDLIVVEWTHDSRGSCWKKRLGGSFFSIYPDTDDVLVRIKGPVSDA